MTIWLRLLLVSFFIFQGCTVTTKRAPKKADHLSLQKYEGAKKDLAAGRTRAAIEKLQAVLESDAGSDVADDSALLLGNIYFRNQNYELALDAFMKIVNSDTLSEFDLEARYLSGLCLYFLDRFDESAGLLNQLSQNRGLSADLQIKVHELLYKIYLQQSDFLSALRSMDYLLGLDLPADKAGALRLEAQQLIESRLSWDSVLAVAESSSYGQVRGYALNLLAKHYAELREYDRAARYYQQVIDLLPGSEFATEAETFLRQVEARKTVNPKTIGVVLPLTGRHSKIAYKTLHGIQMALGIYDHPRSPYRLAVVDSEGDPDIAQKAVERLVMEDHVIAVIGSLLSRTAEAVSKTAHNFGVPSIALSQKSNITDLGSSVFRHALTSDMQIEYLVKTAMEDYGLRKFAILYPNEPYGVEYANIFWDHVRARGGEITGAQTYAPGETDFNGSIRRLIGTFYLEDRMEEYKFHLREWKKKHLKMARNSPPEDLLPPVVDFEAIFIPDGTKALAQIAPMLRYNDVPQVLLLGTNLWNSPSLTTRLPGELAESTLFVDSVMMSPEQMEKTPFHQKFLKIFGEAPGHFEIRGYDAALLLRSALDSGAKNRAELIERLTSVKDLSAVEGRLSVNSRREVSMPISTLTVKNKAIKKIYKNEKSL